MKDLGYLHYFLGIQVQKFPDGLFLNQAKYTTELHEKAFMDKCKPISMPMMTKLQSSAHTIDTFKDPEFYQSIVWAL